MNTDELLVAIRPEFPELTDKTLRDWVKEGFLQSPVRVGMGSEGGTPNEWADDSIARIRVIKSVTNKRIDKSRARRALIAAGYFIGVTALRDELLDGIDAIDNTFSSSKRFGDGGATKPGNGGVLDVDLRVIISTALISPTPLFDKLYAAIREYGVSEYTVTEDRTTSSPLTEVLELFSIYELERNLETISDDVLVRAFYDGYNASNFMMPVVGWLWGYDEYPPISDNSPLMQYVKRNTQTPKIERYEFEYLCRLSCIAGCLIIDIKRDKFLDLLPRALTFAFTHTMLNVKEDAQGELTIEEGDKYIHVDEINSAISDVITSTHKENIQVVQSLFK